MWLYFNKPPLESSNFQLKAFLIHTDWLGTFILLYFHRKGEGFHGGPVVETTLQFREHGFNPGPGGSHMLQGS